MKELGRGGVDVEERMRRSY